MLGRGRRNVLGRGEYLRCSQTGQLHRGPHSRRAFPRPKTQNKISGKNGVRFRVRVCFALSQVRLSLRRDTRITSLNAFRAGAATPTPGCHPRILKLAADPSSHELVAFSLFLFRSPPPPTLLLFHSRLRTRSRCPRLNLHLVASRPVYSLLFVLHLFKLRKQSLVLPFSFGVQSPVSSSQLTWAPSTCTYIHSCSSQP